MANQNSNNGAAQEGTIKNSSGMRKSPTSLNFKNEVIQTLNKKPSQQNLKSVKISSSRPVSSRNQQDLSNIGSGNGDKSQNKQEQQMSQLEAISINLPSNNQSSVSSKRKQYTPSDQLQKLQIIKQISKQRNNIHFSKTLKSNDQKSNAKNQQISTNSKSDVNQDVTEEDYIQKEQYLDLIHKELKNRSIEMLTDQLMLKEKEIQTLKKQLEIMRTQLTDSKSYQSSSAHKQYYSHQEDSNRKVEQFVLQEQIKQSKFVALEEESKSQEGLSFNDSSLQAIQQKEDPFVDLGAKTLKRSNNDKNFNSQRSLPNKGLVKSGSSQLNNKLGKMKSTADLFGDLRKVVQGGETIQDYIMKQKPINQINLEEIIKESMIEASEISKHGDLLNEGQDQDLNLNEKSLSLEGECGQGGQDHLILDELFGQRQSKISAGELEKLCETSSVIFMDRQNNNYKQNNYRLTKPQGDPPARQNAQSQQKHAQNNNNGGMNDDLSDAQQDNDNNNNNEDNYILKELQEEIRQQQKPLFDAKSPFFSTGNNNLFNLDSIQHTENDFQDYGHESNANNSQSQNHQQSIERNEESLTSKQTNEYMVDLAVPRNINLKNDQLEVFHPEQIVDSPPICDRQSNNSNDTAKLSFSKDQENDGVGGDSFDKNMEMALMSNQKVLKTPNIALQTQSIMSIGDLLKESPRVLFSDQKVTTNYSNNINKIQALNLVERKKSIEFTSPLASEIFKQQTMNKSDSKTLIFSNQSQNQQRTSNATQTSQNNKVLSQGFNSQSMANLNQYKQQQQQLEQINEKFSSNIIQENSDRQKGKALINLVNGPITSSGMNRQKSYGTLGTAQFLENQSKKSMAQLNMRLNNIKK